MGMRFIGSGENAILLVLSRVTLTMCLIHTPEIEMVCLMVVLTKHKTINDLMEFVECLGERLSSKSNFVPFEVTNVSLSDILNNSK